MRKCSKAAWHGKVAWLRRADAKRIQSARVA